MRGTAEVATGTGGEPEAMAWAVLASVRGVGPVTFGRLIAAFGTATTVLELARRPDGPRRLVAATSEDGAAPSLTPAGAAAVADASLPESRDALRDAIVAAGVAVVTLPDAAYPARLRAIDDPPPVLYVRGDPAALARERSVAVVGTRRPTGPGRALAARIAESVAERGATVVSGLAYGVDAAAHAATVRLGRPTVAVIGGGHGRLYPASHRQLTSGIVAAGGAVVSELAPDVEPTRGTFPRRNRIISGLADATVVVEAGIRSGALTTAAWALEQGRGLHLVPGRPGDPSVAGTLAFLREAGPEARIVAGIPELLEDLGLLDPGSDHDGRRVADAVVLAGLGAAERMVAAALARGTETVDRLVGATGMPPAAVLGALTMLEMRGLVIDVFGRYRPVGNGAARPRRTTVRVAARLRCG